MTNNATSHAKYPPSAGYRWLNCTASMTLPERKQIESVHSMRGVCLHSLAEDMLKGNQPRLEYDGHTYTQDDLDEIVIPYVEYVKNLKATQYFYEKKVEICKDCYGTADVIAYDKEDDCLHCIDLKTGSGVYVEVKDNIQLQIYAIGAINFFIKEFAIKPSKIVIHVCQPSLNNLKSWEVSIDELKSLRKKVLNTIRDIEGNKVEFKPSEKACKFCNHKPFCPELKKIADKIAREEFEDLDLSEKLKLVPILKQFIAAVEEESLLLMKQGRKLDGFKLILGKGSRKWTNEKAVESFLKENDFKEDDIFIKKFISPAQTEKLVKKSKKEINLTPYIKKLDGAPKVVLETDKGEEINRLEDAKKDFEKLYIQT